MLKRMVTYNTSFKSGKKQVTHCIVLLQPQSLSDICMWSAY